MPSGGCCDGVQSNGALVQRDKAKASAGLATGGRRVTVQGDDVQSDDVRGGDRMRRARRSHAR
jgi:hypothetical protein